jgi:hypothetical protein
MERSSTYQFTVRITCASAPRTPFKVSRSPYSWLGSLVCNFNCIASIYIDHRRLVSVVHVVAAASDGFVIVFPVGGIHEDSSVVVGIVQPTFFKRGSSVPRVGRGLVGFEGMGSQDRKSRQRTKISTYRMPPAPRGASQLPLCEKRTNMSGLVR